jgi:hypothetical protein
MLDLGNSHRISRRGFAMAATLSLSVMAANILAPTTVAAQDAGMYPRFIGSSQDGEIDYGPGGHGNVVGGGVAHVVGSSQDGEIAYSGPAQSQEPMFAFSVGSGENAQIVYSRSPDRATALAEAGVLPSGSLRAGGFATARVAEVVQLGR